MSIQDVGWVLGQNIVNTGAKLVLVSIANHIHSKMDYAFPSIDNLAEEASMSRRSVQRHIKWLEDQQYLIVEASYDVTSRQTSNRYRLNFNRPEEQSREGDKLAPSKEAIDFVEGGGCQIDTPGCQIDTEEGDTGDTPEGDTAVTPLIGIITGINKNPLPQTTVKRRKKRSNGTPLPAEQQRVFVVQYSPQWEAWVRHRGNTVPTGNYRDPETGRYLTGWWFDTLWPPGYAEAS
ncbi:helix-turn-helix domain-containing protein [Cohaesibacter haloalkalitolerans]|uniref:helix-turn-helix domain-containing protein n=1 Tax=Cohaesibacter haloalkalitolerans TaxID=1162980 RepID=UPI000E65B86D|nr:helix-turn-helix domain-containing protein [Cohaesibacter haloalkalitolerans]